MKSSLAFENNFDKKYYVAFEGTIQIKQIFKKFFILYSFFIKLDNITSVDNFLIPLNKLYYRKFF